MGLEGHWLGSTIVRCGLWPKSVPWFGQDVLYCRNAMILFIKDDAFRIYCRYHITKVLNIHKCMSYIYIYCISCIPCISHLYVLICVDIWWHFQSSYATVTSSHGEILMELCVCVHSSEIMIISIYQSYPNKRLMTKHWKKLSLVLHRSFHIPCCWDSVPNLWPQTWFLWQREPNGPLC